MIRAWEQNARLSSSESIRIDLVGAVSDIAVGLGGIAYYFSRGTVTSRPSRPVKDIVYIFPEDIFSRTRRLEDNYILRYFSHRRDSQECDCAFRSVWSRSRASGFRSGVFENLREILRETRDCEQTCPTVSREGLQKKSVESLSSPSWIIPWTESL